MRTPVDSFVACLDAERLAGTDRAKFPILTIHIADQEELRRLYTLAELTGAKPVPMVRRHLRGWSRDRLEECS